MAKGTLTVRVLGDTKPFSKAVGGIGGKLGKLAKAGAAAFAVAGAAAVTGAFKVAEFGDEVAKSAGKAGLAVEPFQELRFAFGQGGVEAATMDTALLKFNKRLGESATGVGTADDAFAALGVSLTDADGGVRDAGGAIDEVLPKLAAIESDAERASLAGDLFGQRAGPELAAALSDGIGGIDAAREKAQELGIVMGGPAAEAAEKFTDQFDDIKQSALGFAREALTPLMVLMSDKVFPAIQDGIGRLRELKVVFGEAGGGADGLKAVFADLFGGEGGGLFAGILDAARSAIASLVEWLAGDGFTQIFTFIMESRERLFEAAMTLFPALLEAAVTFLPQLLAWFTETMIPRLLEFIVTSVPTLLDAAVTLFTSLVDAVVQVLPNLISTLLDDVLPTVLETVLGMIPQLLETAVELFMMLVDAVVEVLPDLISTLLGDVLPEVLDALLGMIPELLNTAVELFLMLVDAVIEVLPELLQTLLVDVLPQVLETILGMIPELLEAAIEAFFALVTGLLDVLPDLLDTLLVDVLPQVIETLIGMIPELLVASFDVFMALVDGLLDALPELLTTIVTEVIPGVVGAVLEMVPKLVAIGGDIVGGIWDGIKGTGSWLKDKVVGWAADVLPGPIADLLGISSPSKLFAEMGRDVGRGLAQGIEGSRRWVESASADLAKAAQVDASTTLSATMPPGGVALAGGQTSTAYMRMHPDDLRTMARMVVQISRAA